MCLSCECVLETLPNEGPYIGGLSRSRSLVPLIDWLLGENDRESGQTRTRHEENVSSFILELTSHKRPRCTV